MGLSNGLQGKARSCFFTKIYMCKKAGFLHKKAAFLQKYFVRNQRFLHKKAEFFHKKAAFLQIYVFIKSRFFTLI